MGGDGTVGRASVPRRSARDDGAHLPTDERSFEMLQLHFRGRAAAAFSSDNFCPTISSRIRISMLPSDSLAERNVAL